MKNDLVLASASPRRLSLLGQIGIEPSLVEPTDIDETPLKGEGARDMAVRLALAKARKASLLHTNCFILAADTVVASGARILPKAETEAEARTCITRLSGRRHHVYGGIALIAPDGKVIHRVCDTLVQFKALNEREIENYIKSHEWQGKAGGYAIQGFAEGFIKYIQGSYSNVVGLSLYDTLQMLKGAGYKF